MKVKRFNEDFGYNEPNEDEDVQNQYEISEELKACLPCIKKLRSEIGFDFGRAGIVHQWFEDNNIDIMGMSDLDMYIMFIEKNS